MSVLIGTSGWHYRHWRGGLYPNTVKAPDWLGHYAQRFATVEVNNAFYRLPESSTFEHWAANLPEDFIMAVKASRYLTHIRRLREPEDAVHRLMQRVAALGKKLGPILLQLPPTLKRDEEALERTLAAFPQHTRIAVEFRHSSWFASSVKNLLQTRDVACCLTDMGGRHGPFWRTASWGYIRLHQGRAQPPPCYGHTALQSWARRIAELWSIDADVFVFFNNDGHGCAPRDAHRFALAAHGAGLWPTRVPSARETPLT